MTIQLYLNGEERSDFQATTVEKLIIELNLEPSTILVEYNGAALPRKKWPTTPLEKGNHIELLHVVAGG